MKILKLLFVGIIIIPTLCACGDFFEEDSQNQAYVSSVADLDELLMGEAYINVPGFAISLKAHQSQLLTHADKYFPWIHLQDDDITEFAEGYDSSIDSWIRSNTASAYRWQENPFWNKEHVEYKPDDWEKAYKRIAILNSILSELDNVREGESDTLANRVAGEAYFLRAYNYYWLVNVYAQPYALSSADKELGVPLKIVGEVEDKHFSRVSVQAVYTQIRSDLANSVAAFREIPKYSRPIRADYTAACILMSRVCLYMEDYEEAVAYADSAILRESHSILDLNSLEEGDSFTYEGSPETVFTQGGYIMAQIHTSDACWWNSSSTASSYKTSDDLLNCYGENDLRRKIFFTHPPFSTDAWRCLKFREESGRIGDYMLFRFPEAYLNKAEAQAILGDEAGAKSTLNVLREKRFLVGEMPAIEEEMARSGENLVNFIRSERRREFCYEGQRWFDLRRYAVNSKYPFSKPIRHEVRERQGGEGAEGHYVTVGYYELKPYAEDRAAYVFPLPSSEIIFNKGTLVQNEDRPARKMVRY